MHDFTTFENTIPLYDDDDPIRKHLKKFKCCKCNKNKFHIPFDTDDGKTVCIDCIRTGSGHTIVLNDRTIRDLEAVANRINGTDNYPPKETTEPTTTNKETKITLFDITRKDIKDFFSKENRPVWIPTIVCSLFIVVFPIVTSRLFLG